jgi:hypothetical protein
MAVLLSSMPELELRRMDLIALHAANGSGRGREDRHFKFYADRDILVDLASHT